MTDRYERIRDATRLVSRDGRESMDKKQQLIAELKQLIELAEAGVLNEEEEHLLDDMALWYHEYLTMKRALPNAV